MALQVSPLTKIICLSGVLALGFLLIILSCALFHNFYPLFDVLIFLLAPLPNALFGQSDGFSSQGEFLNESGRSGEDFGHFVTGLLVSSGILLPIVFYHSNLINYESALMTVSGGLIIYLCIVVFTWFFNGSWEADDDNLFGY
ncbi:unnamed protein product [Kluyveromyces dobzhanskii CBS 2104]|uniref:WGS project CCBQ000000000 data, contig 00011 n=1 Tax=Kluyveromyces dobzhanskii CBS 2104 TaxID=1427455 RepID=A0A0A8L7R0_9SACH|nr:unnamed protein product [Kluyveromyces dobzhanskii CBS 2104]